MSDTIRSTTDAVQQSEHDLLENTVNIALIVLSGLGIVVVALTHVRALSIGWTPREGVQLFALVVVFLTALYRNRLSVRWKVNTLVTLSSIVALATFLTLGVFGSGVFFVPIAATIGAISFKGRALALYTAGALLGTAAVAAAFASGRLQVAGAVELLQSPLHWAIYVMGMSIGVIFVAVIVYRFRVSHERLLELATAQRNELSEANGQLRSALAEIRTLRGIIPICSYCHSIRSDSGAWDQLEVYLDTHSDAEFSHGICPSCLVGLEREMDLEEEDPVL
jgi:hypothetical protein